MPSYVKKCSACGATARVAFYSSKAPKGKKFAYPVCVMCAETTFEASEPSWLEHVEAGTSYLAEVGA